MVFLVYIRRTAVGITSSGLVYTTYNTGCLLPVSLKLPFAASARLSRRALLAFLLFGITGTISATAVDFYVPVSTLRFTAPTRPRHGCPDHYCHTSRRSLPPPPRRRSCLPGLYTMINGDYWPPSSLPPPLLLHESSLDPSTTDAAAPLPPPASKPWHY